jgi:hypothetical protein
LYQGDTVYDVLEYLASGMMQEEVLEDFSVSDEGRYSGVSGVRRRP